MGCGETFVKYVLFIVNLIFALAGLALLGIGIAVQLQIKVIAEIANGYFQSAPIASMVVGALAFFIAFFGCCGAIRESNCMLVIFSIFMLLLMIVKLTLAILLFVKLDDIVADVPKWLNQSFTQNQTAFQDIERSFTCCGPTGAFSYQGMVIPNSCCATPPCTVLNSYSGCNPVVQDFFHSFGIAMGVVAIVIVAIELVAAIFGLCLANNVRNKSRRAQY